MFTCEHTIESRTTLPTYIEDGFTVEDVFPRAAWQASFKFRYRPAIPKDVHKYYLDKQDDPRRIHDINVAFILKHTDSWDAKDKAGQVLMLTPKTFDRVPVQAQLFMVNCILGNGPEHADLEADAKN